MAIRQVLLNGAGTSGDGTTWNDLSDATSAFIGTAGLAAAITASAAGDTVYVKGSGTSATAFTPTGITLAKAQNPPRVLGCKSATTNNQGAIVETDLIDGFRANGGTTAAYLDADVPVVTITGGASDITLDMGYYYGISFVCDDDIFLARNSNSAVVAEECNFETTSGADRVLLGFTNPGTLKTRNCQFKLFSSGVIYLGSIVSEHIGTVLSVPGVNGIFGNFTGAVIQGYHIFRGCDLSPGGETTIFNKQSLVTGHVVLENCKFPASWVFTGGTATGPYRFESYGSDDTTGLTTGGSEQQIDIETQHGTVTTETVKVRTGGADDGAAGLFSLDMSAFASGTAAGITGLESPWMPVWVKGDGTAKVITVYFTSDSANTNTSDWNDDQVSMEVVSADDAGASKYDYLTTVADLLDTPVAVTDDTGSTWGAGTARDQKIQGSISPDYEGYAKCRIIFSPEANADTIYVCPFLEVA